MAQDIRVTQDHVYVELEPVQRTEVLAVRALVERVPSATTIAITAVRAYVEMQPSGSGIAYATAERAYVEMEPITHVVHITAIQAYVEMVAVGGDANEIRTTAIQAYVELLNHDVGGVGGYHVSAEGVYAELEASSGVEVSGESTYVEIEAEAGVRQTALGTYVELDPVGMVYASALGLYLELREYTPPMPTYIPSSAGTRRMHRLLPDEVNGYAFDPEYSWWSSVVPEESSNLIVNPSFEGWNAIGNVVEAQDGGTITLEWVEFPSVGATVGRRCAKLTSTAGQTGWIVYDAGLLVAPGHYTFSCDVYVSRVPYTLRLVVTGTGGVGNYSWREFTVRESGWHRYHITHTELGSGNREARLVLMNTNSFANVVYTDAWQFENKPYPTTYLDGDQMGFSDHAPGESYFWHGEPHHSMSTRRARTGSGGRLLSWSQEARFRTTSIVGLGMSALEQKTQTLGDGRQVHLGWLPRGRDFTITGRIFAVSPRDLRDRHNDLMRLLKPNNTPGGDQMVLRFQEVDDNEKLVGGPLEITCVYREGMQGNMTNFYQEALPIQFHAVDPYLRDVIESAFELTLNKTVEDNGLLFRDEEGDYINLGTGDTLGGVVARVGFLRTGEVIAFGNFTTIAGDVVAYGAVWNGSNWEALAVTSPDGVTDIDDGYHVDYELAVADVDGNVYQYDYISQLWDQLGDGFIGPLNALHRDINGDIWVAGEFEFAFDGVTTYNNVAKWNATTLAWEQLGQGLTDPGGLNPELNATAVLATNDGNVYFGGWFERGTNTSGSTVTLANSAIRWDIDLQVWSAMGTGLNAAPNEFILGQDGFIYAVGPFSMNGTETYALRGFARYNGYEWEEVFPLIKQDGSYGAEGVIQDEDGIFWFQNFVADPANDLYVVEGLGEVGFFGYRNGIVYPPYLEDASIFHSASGPGNRMMHVVRKHTITDGLVVPALNRVTYAGSADAPLALHIEGVCDFGQVVNLRTQGGVYGRGLSLSNAEHMVIRSDVQRALTYSNQRPNLQTRLSIGATNLKALRLVPGENRISVFCAHVDEALGWLGWKNRFWGLEDSRD